MRYGFAFALVTAGLWSVPSHAQVLYGTVLGTVRDSTGAVVPNAAVALTNQQTNQTRTDSTSGVGLYTFSNVMQGSYKLEVTATGFQPFAQTELRVTINTVARVDVELRVGQIAETLTVSAAAATLQTDKADVHADLAAREVTTLPLPSYRNYQSLINLVPGATPAAFQNAINDTPARSLYTNINGTNRNSNNTRVDGALNKYNIISSHTLYVPPAESIETVNISTNAFDSEQGMTGGAAITVVTKSGTNELHGTAFGYHDNQKLRAKNFFFRDPRKPKSIVNIDGGTVGGPLRRDKLFYFMSWEGTFERINRSGLYTVSTADQRRGDFNALNTTVYDPATGAADGRGRTQFDGNLIPLSRQSAITRKFQDLIPLPNQSGVTSNFFASGTQVLNRHNGDVKVNWNRTNSHSIWGKYSVMKALVDCSFALGAAGGPGLCDGGPESSDTLVQVATIGHTWTITPRLLVDGNAGYSRLGLSAVAADYGPNFGLNVLGIPGTNGPDIRQSGIPIFTITGYSALGSPDAWAPVFRTDATYTHSSNVNWNKGSHDMRFGFDAIRFHQNDWQPNITGGPRGQFQFDGGVTALNGGRAPNQFNGYADYLMGLPGTMRKALQFYSPQTAREWQFGGYFRDRWQASQNLTVTLGLRYEYYPQVTRANIGVERYEFDTNKVIIGRHGGNPDNVGVEFGKKLFAPRIGLAYRLGTNSVIRSGYGISIDPTTVSGAIQRPYPVVVGKEFFAANSFVPFRPIEQGIPLFGGPDINSGLIDLPVDAQTMTQAKGPFRRGYIESWNLIVERKLPAEIVTTIGYVGTQTVRQFAFPDLNAGVPGLGLAGKPLYARFGRSATTQLFDPAYGANYHSLQATVDRRFSRGLFVKGSYTYSHAIDFTDTSPGSFLFNVPSDYRRNRALAGYDRPHVLQLSWIYELPFKHLLARGWQINGIFSAYTGVPFNVTSSGASLNAPGNTQTADQVLPEVRKLGGIGATSPWFDPAAFRAVTEVRYGTTGRNILRGPGVVNCDVGVSRTFPVKERLRILVRGEAFNSANTPHFSNPSGNASNPATLGTITAATQDQRVFRLALRLAF